MKSTIINKISTLTLRSLLCMTSTASLLSASLPDEISGAPLTAITGAMIPAAAVNILEKVPSEIQHHILSYLSLRDIHKNVLPVSKAYHAIAETEFRYQLNFLFQYHDPNSAKALELREFIKKSPLGIRLLAKEKDLPTLCHTESLKTQWWTMMPARSPLVDDFAAKEPLQQISLLQVMGEKALLGIFFPKEEATDAHRALVQHLCTQWDKMTAVFMTQKNVERAKASFKKSEANDPIPPSLQRMYAQNAYVFGDALWKDDASLNAKPHHLIVTRADLADQKKKDRLGALLAANANHTLMLHVDATETKGVLTLATADLPANLRHLVISDTHNSVTTIGDNFLHDARALRTFDTGGLTALQAIGDWFLCGAHALRTFDTGGLTALETIGYQFLADAHALETFDTGGLTALHTIGNGFLSHAHALETLDTRGLTALKTIGDWFLYDAHALRTLDTRGFTDLQTIGNMFLFGENHLRSLEASPALVDRLLGKTYVKLIARP